MTSTTGLICTWRGEILREWTDYNGHLRDAFYMLLFSYATDGLMDRIGLDEVGRRETGHSLFTLEAHINYLHEVKEGASVEVYTQLIGYKEKRAHVYHGLFLPGAQRLVAANEQLLVNVDISGPFSTPFAAPVQEQLKTLWATQETLARPAHVGRAVKLGTV